MTRRGRAAAVAATLVAGGAIAGTWAWLQASEQSPPGVAHVWVDADGGTCTRFAVPTPYDDAAACATFDAAYDAANSSSAASSVLVRGGTYADPAPCAGATSSAWTAPTYPCVSITGTRTSPGRITIAAAPDEIVRTGAITIGESEGSTVTPEEGPDNVTLRDLEVMTFAEAGLPFENGDSRFSVTVVNGSRSVQLENLTAGAFVAYSAHDLEIVGGSYGPCRAQSARDVHGEDGADGPLGNGPQPCNGARADHATDGCEPDCIPTSIVIDGVELHDFDYSDECLAQGRPGYRFPPGVTGEGCHWRSLYLNCVRNVTLRNSTVRDSVFSPWTTHSGCANGTEGLVVENNQFGRPVWQAGDYASGPGGGWENAYCETGEQPTYRDVTIRFNSFAPGATAAFPGSGEGQENCETAGFEVYGNIFGLRPACTTGASQESAGPAPSRVTWRYNVYADDVGDLCDETDVTVDSRMPFYATDDAGPEPGAFALTGDAFAGDDLVPAGDPEFPCPETDATGNSRPQGAGRFCDAGAFERRE